MIDNKLYLEKGKGEPIILLHGLFGALSNWMTVVNKFAKSHRVIIPKIPSIKIIDLAKMVAPKSKIKIIGVRPGEKLHEELISIHESRNCFNFNDKYLILDPLNLKLVKFYKKKGAKIVKDNFHYDSFSNKKNLSKKQLMKLQRKLNN